MFLLHSLQQPSKLARVAGQTRITPEALATLLADAMGFQIVANIARRGNGRRHIVGCFSRQLYVTLSTQNSSIAIE